MGKINIELTVEQYKNVHLLLHNLIELSESISTRDKKFKEVSTSLELIKNTLDVNV